MRSPKGNDMNENWREWLTPWKSRGALLRGARRLPKTLSSLQIILLCAFVSIVLIKNTIGVGNITPSSQQPILHLDVDGRLNEPNRDLEQVDDTKNVKEDKSIGAEKKIEKQVVEKVMLENEMVEENFDLVTQEEISTTKQPEELVGAHNEKNDQEAKTVVSDNQRKLESEVEEYPHLAIEHGTQPFSLGPTIKDWDEQRSSWFEKNPHLRSNADGKPRVLLVTGSPPWACKNPVGDHLLLLSTKNKIDYCRQHKMEIFYNLAHLDKELSSYWAKLPLLRRLMLSHPEVEWMLWMDSDALFTDMLFEIPIDKYADYNLVMFGYDDGIYKEKSWVSVNDGVFLLRNCQWTLDLFEMWAPMGPEGKIREAYGKMLTEFLTKRPTMPADDQSALVYLLIKHENLRPKVKLVWEYYLSGYWRDIVDHFEEYMKKDHPGLGDTRWPFTTHFTGCQPCSGVHNPDYTPELCVQQMERAFNFADNQVLQMMGFQHENLWTMDVKRIREETDRPLENLSENPWATSSTAGEL